MVSGWGQTRKRPLLSKESLKLHVQMVVKHKQVLLYLGWGPAGRGQSAHLRMGSKFTGLPVRAALALPQRHRNAGPTALEGFAFPI